MTWSRKFRTFLSFAKWPIKYQSINNLKECCETFLSLLHSSFVLQGQKPLLFVFLRLSAAIWSRAWICRSSLLHIWIPPDFGTVVVGCCTPASSRRPQIVQQAHTDDGSMTHQMKIAFSQMVAVKKNQRLRGQRSLSATRYEDVSVQHRHEEVLTHTRRPPLSWFVMAPLPGSQLVFDWLPYTHWSRPEAQRKKDRMTWHSFINSA